MRRSTRLFSAIVAVASLTAGSVGASLADSVKVSDPCPGACIFFGASGAIPAIRSIVLAAPHAGNATVTFHGSLYCVSASTAFSTVYLSSQIVEGAANVNGTGPSALTVAATFEPASASHPRIFSYNVASTRIFSIAGAGSHTYRFKIDRFLPMPANLNCAIYNGQISVHFS